MYRFELAVLLIVLLGPLHQGTAHAQSKAEAEAALPAADTAAAATKMPEDVPVRADFAIVYEGRTGGLSAARTDLWAEPRIGASLQQAPGDWQRSAIGFGAFLSRGRWLLQSSDGVASFAQRAQTGIAAASVQEQEVPILVSDDYAVIAWPAETAAAVLPILEAALDTDPLRPPPLREARTVSPVNADAGMLFVKPNLDRAPLEQAIESVHWEARLRSVFTGKTEAGQPAFVYVVSRLEGEGSRRAELLGRWDASKNLYLSAGEAVEGRSFLSDQAISLQRPNTWQFWKEQGLDGLAPGEAELLVGVDTLRTEAAEAGVPLLSANLADPAGKSLFERWRLVEIAGRRVVLIGWSDPQLLDRLPPEQRSRVRIRDRSALFEVLTELSTALETPADLVVLFGVGARQLAGHLPGVDLVLGDFTADLRLPRWEEIGESALRARAIEHRRARSPALVARLGGGLLGRIDVSFDPDTGVLRRLGHLRARIGEELPANLPWLEKIQAVRQDVYSQLEDILLPDLGSLAMAPDGARVVTLDARGFALLTANLMMERTGADLSILRPLPTVPEVAGPAQRLFVDAALAVADELVVIEVTGSQLKALNGAIRLLPSEDPASAAAGPLGDLWAWSAGLQVKGSTVLVRGRVVGNDERIRLATTDFVYGDSRINAALKKAPSWRHFQGPGWRRQPAIAGRGNPWPLRELVKDALVDLRSLDPEFGSRYSSRLRPLLSDQRGISPRFTLELDGIALQVTGSVPVGNRGGYESSRESRVQQESSLSATLRGRIAGTYDDKRGAVTVFFKGAFGRSKLPGVEEPVELEDDLLLGAEGRLKVVTLPGKLSGVRLSSFARSAFDSEFARGDDGAGGKLPRQTLWRTTAGASLSKYLWFKEFKGGFFVEYDFAAEAGHLTPGFSTSLLAEKRWGPVRWSALGDLKGYLPTDGDSEDDLLFTLQLRSDVSVIPLGKLVPGLSVGGFVDALIFRGKVDANAHPGMHLLVGAALTYDRDLRAPLPLR